VKEINGKRGGGGRAVSEDGGELWMEVNKA